MYLSLYCKGSKRLFKVLPWEGVGDWTELQYIDPYSYGHQRCVFLILQGCSTRGQEPSSLLDDGFLYCILSATSLDPNSIGGPEGLFNLVWLSYHILSLTPTVSVWLLSWLSYIIVERPLNLWNGMFDRHQAEITVIQFRGHSLPVHQSMSVSWDFLPCPISLAKHAYAIFSHNCHWNVSIPSGASPWNGKFGRVEGQNTTIELFWHLTVFKQRLHLHSHSTELFELELFD